MQARLPGPEWKERYGAAGTPADERRSSPIVEISLLLARHTPGSSPVRVCGRPPGGSGAEQRVAAASARATCGARREQLRLVCRVQAPR
jgi:hypothetical protein